MERNQGDERMSREEGTLTRADLDDALEECDDRGGLVIIDHRARPWIITTDDDGWRWAISTWYEEDDSNPPFILERSPVAFPVRLMAPVVQVRS